MSHPLTEGPDTYTYPVLLKQVADEEGVPVGFFAGELRSRGLATVTRESQGEQKVCTWEFTFDATGEPAGWNDACIDMLRDIAQEW